MIDLLYIIVFFACSLPRNSVYGTNRKARLVSYVGVEGGKAGVLVQETWID